MRFWRPPCCLLHQGHIRVTRGRWVFLTSKSTKQRSKFLSEPHRPRILKDRAFCTRESVLSTLIRKSPAFKRGLMLAPFELFNSEYRSSDAFATDLQGISLYVSPGCKTAANLWQPNTLCKNQRIGTYNCYVQWCRDFSHLSTNSRRIFVTETGYFVTK